MNTPRGACHYCDIGEYLNDMGPVLLRDLRSPQPSLETWKRALVILDHFVATQCVRRYEGKPSRVFTPENQWLCAIHLNMLCTAYPTPRPREGNWTTPTAVDVVRALRSAERPLSTEEVIQIFRERNGDPRAVTREAMEKALALGFVATVSKGSQKLWRLASGSMPATLALRTLEAGVLIPATTHMEAGAMNEMASSLAQQERMPGE